MASAVSAAEPQVVVLKNGNVLKGEVALLGDRVQVSLTAGGEITVPASNVEMTTRDLPEAYARLAQRLRAGRIEDHLDMADWCVRHELVSQATSHFVSALRIDAKHPRVLALERKLNSLAAAREASRPSQPAAGSAVAFPSIDQLEETMRSLPAGSVETFTTVVQPLLLHRCGASGCHGGETNSSFKLMQPPIGQSLTRRFTQRNLHAALSFVDREQPESSELLTKARQAHGSRKQPPLGDRDQQSLANLRHWLMISGNHREPTPRTINEPAANLLQTTDISRSLTVPPDSAESAADATAPASIAPSSPPFAKPEAAAAPTASPAARSRTERKVQRGAASPTFTPRDPFDPEIFNRR